MSDTPIADEARYVLGSCVDPLNKACEIIEGLERELTALRAENERLREDAERYRWLRGQNKYRSENVRVQVSQGPNWVYPSNFYLDSAIDAAIAQGKGEK